jgi:hypothetical protein
LPLCPGLNRVFFPASTIFEFTSSSGRDTVLIGIHDLRCRGFASKTLSPCSKVRLVDAP